MKRNYTRLEDSWKILSSITPNSTKASAVLFDPELTTPHAIISATNTFPAGALHDTERLHRPAKYIFLGHAEEQLIANCARHGVSTYMKGVYMHWFPCFTCARILIGAGISHLVCDPPELDGDLDKQWKFTEALQMLTESGVKIIYRD